MPNYDDGKIYKIVCNTRGLVYYGSTCQLLSKRFATHSSDFRYHLKGTKHLCTSAKVLENGDAHIELVELVNTKEKMVERERYYIKNFECVNKFIPGRTRKQYYADNEEKIKKYRLDSKDKQINYKKQYYLDNKDKIKQRTKQYKLDNKEIINQKDNQRYHYQCSWGGDKRYNNNLLCIDLNLFN